MTNPFEAPANSRVRGLSIGAILFTVYGRIPRSTYWFASIGSTVVFYAMVFAVLLIDDAATGGSFIPSIFILGAMPLFIWVNIAVQVKRWHDRNKSGLWILIGMVPLIGGIWSFVECGLLPGSRGPNKYGVDPLGREY